MTTPSGIQLAFLPVPAADGGIRHFEIYLLNDTPYDVVFTAIFRLGGSTRFKKHGKLDTLKQEMLGLLLFEQLNDGPEFEFDCRQVTTAGSGPRQQKSLKIKARQFFKNVGFHPLLEQEAHAYLIFEKFEAQEQSKKEDLRSYTQRNMHASRELMQQDLAAYQPVPDTKELASFAPEIDLHIEKLLDDASGKSNTDIIRIQLAAFDQFLEKAIRLGVPRIFVIHGVGKGKLKNEIASRLIQHPDVTTFKNEYHPRYGWGATEIIL